MTEPEKAVKIVKTESTSPAGFGLRKSVKDPRIEIKEYLRRKSIISKGIPSDRVGPSINGLFLGMKWEDAFQWIDTHVMEKCEFRGLDSGVLAGSVFIKFESPSMESRSSDPAEEKRGNYLCIDPDSGLLTDFSFCGTTLDRIFRSESMTSKEFASWYSRKFGTEAFIPDEDTPGMFMLNNQLTKTFICASSTFNPNFKILCSGIVR
ncbi:MAG: hypothetical protein JWO82_2584 [Akkermansiaceae bacterium]|nr:hypothetical protein [Akkermansiaceae bacterium]